jgi:hypothetical protein
MLHPA